MALEKLLRAEERLWAPEHLRQQANLQDFQGEYQRSLEDPEGFWGAWARRFHWERPFERVLEWNLPEHRWFLGGTTNTVYNALERNVARGLRNKVALVYLSEEGREEKLTYGELLDRVRRLATGLRRLGVGKGDRVVLYMPLTLEGVMAMLATTYLGAIHSVVYAGLGVAALREPFQSFFGGTGLGLFLARRLLEGLGGRIWLEETEGEGASFAFTLPLEVERADPSGGR